IQDPQTKSRPGSARQAPFEWSSTVEANCCRLEELFPFDCSRPLLQRRLRISAPSPTLYAGRTPARTVAPVDANAQSGPEACTSAWLRSNPPHTRSVAFFVPTLSPSVGVVC